MLRTPDLYRIHHRVSWRSYGLLVLCLIWAPPTTGGAQKQQGTASEQSLQQALNEAPLPAVRLDGNYFSRQGRGFIPVGANWVPAQTAMAWPYEWDPKSVEADFARMHELGFNTIRLDMVWAWFEPRPGDFNPEAFKGLDFLISLAHRYHIYLHPMLLIGGEVGKPIGTCRIVRVVIPSLTRTCCDWRPTSPPSLLAVTTRRAPFLPGTLQIGRAHV